MAWRAELVFDVVGEEASDLAFAVLEAFFCPGVGGRIVVGVHLLIVSIYHHVGLAERALEVGVVLRKHIVLEPEIAQRHGHLDQHLENGIAREYLYQSTEAKYVMNIIVILRVRALEVTRIVTAPEYVDHFTCTAHVQYSGHHTAGVFVIHAANEGHGLG
jgi:hypothetical protein